MDTREFYETFVLLYFFLFFFFRDLILFGRSEICENLLILWNEYCGKIYFLIARRIEARLSQYIFISCISLSSLSFPRDRMKNFIFQKYILKTSFQSSYYYNPSWQSLMEWNKLISSKIRIKGWIEK